MLGFECHDIRTDSLNPTEVSGMLDYGFRFEMQDFINLLSLILAFYHYY